MQPLTSFSVATPSSGTAGDVNFTINFPTDTTNWTRVDVRRLLGQAAPTCSTGTSVTFVNNSMAGFDGTTVPFTSGTYIDRTGAVSAFYSYTVCVYSGVNIAASYTTGALPVRTYRATPTYIMFLTSTTYTGSAFGSLAYADTLCTTRAATFVSGKDFKAILSDNTTSALTRLALTSSAVRNVAGLQIVASGTTVFGTIAAPSMQDTFVAAGTGTAFNAWTGTTATGASSGSSCTNWTSTTGSGTTGKPTGTTATGKDSWIQRTTLVACTFAYRLYCISATAD